MPQSNIQKSHAKAVHIISNILLSSRSMITVVLDSYLLALLLSYRQGYASDSHTLFKYSDAIYHLGPVAECSQKQYWNMLGHLLYLLGGCLFKLLS